MRATSLLTIMLLFPLLSAAPLDIAGGVEDDNDGLHSHDENVTRRGKHFSHNQFDFSVSVEGDVGSIGHEVNIDVYDGHTDDHHHHEDDTLIECKEGLSVLFKSIDSNNNGIMDAKELLRVCHQNNFQVTESSAVRILTLPDKTVGFNLAKFCELLKDCPSTNRVDLIYFLLELFDKVTCPHKDDLSDVLLENNWRTQNQINAMSENIQRNTVIIEVEKMTGHTIEDLRGRANAGDLGSLTAIANMASLLIKSSIRSSSDVETMAYSDLRNTLIVEASQRFSIEVSILQRMTDRQLLKTFCTGCKVHVGKSTTNIISATVTEGCVCPAVVKKGNWLGDGTYPNEFKVTQDGSSLQVQRIDSDIGWSMDLSFMCKREYARIRKQIRWNERYQTVMDATFEDGTINSGNPFINANPPLEERLFVDSNIARNSKFSLVHQLKKSDPSVSGSKRCESDNMKMMEGRIRAGTQFFYGFSIYLPSTWQFGAGEDDILVQWKGMGSAPFMFLTQKHEGLFLRVNSHPNPNYDPAEDEADLIKTQWTITTLAQLGRWHDFRVRVIWDFEPEGVGLIEVDYKTEDSFDYTRIKTVVGPNMYNKEGYLKFGIYKPIWQHEPSSTAFDTRTIWHDNVRIGYSIHDVDPAV